MNTMAYSTAKDLLDRKLAKVLSIEGDGLGFGKIMTILVDGKHQCQVHLSAAQAMVINKYYPLI